MWRLEDGHALIRETDNVSKDRVGHALVYDSLQ